MTLETCLESLDRAIEAAEALGLPVDQLRAVRASATGRLGFPSDVYVLTLVGGTGVGKSSLLNALAGTSVSVASARRPTTAQPVAWIPETSSTDLAGLLDWLDVHEVRRHADTDLGPVAILDLPDIDSIQLAHRARVEAVLPKVDAVAWVTDPEKYNDALLHDEYLRRWIPRLERQIVIVNKADRISPDDAERVRHDLAEGLADPALGKGRQPRVVLTSAVTGPAGLADGTADLREWLRGEADAKRVVRARLGTAIAATVGDIARAAGIDTASGNPSPAPLLGTAERDRALEDATVELLRVIDVPGVERQLSAAVRARARTRGGGPLGMLRTAIDQVTGTPSRMADPEAFLARWRERGSVGPAVEAIRRGAASAIPAAPASLRGGVAVAVSPPELPQVMTRLMDDVVSRRAGAAQPTTQRLWFLLGLLQTVATVTLVGGIVWSVIWILARPPVDSVNVPVLGSIPMPLVLVLVGALAGYLLARVLGIHAGLVARRAGRDLRRDLSESVRRGVADAAFARLDHLDSTRAMLASAAASVATCVFSEPAA